MSVRVWTIDRERILHRLRSWARSLAEDDNVTAITLFGSLARGDCTPGSNADLLLLLEGSALPFQDRPAVYAPSGVGIGVDLFV